MPSNSQPGFQVHVARQHVNTFFHVVIDLTQCVTTESVLIAFNVFLNVDLVIHNILEAIQKGFLGSEHARCVAYDTRPHRGLRT